MKQDDGRYLDLVLEPIRVCAKYKPKFGQGAKGEGLTDSIGVNRKVFRTLTGTVFEVRQGYKSKDSKRQNADIANAATAYTKAYFPCAVILSAQIDGDILLRYRAETWAIVTGIEGAKNPLVSTYDFMREVVGYDLAAFFKRNSKTLRKEIDAVLKALLAPGTTP